MNYFIKDTSDLRAATGGGVTENFTFSDIASDIEDAAYNYLRNDLGIGKSFFDNLLADFNDINFQSTTQDSRLFNLLAKVAANFALSAWLDTGTFSIGSNGAVAPKGENEQLPYKWMVEAAKKKRINSAFNTMEMLFDYLEENASYFADWAGSDARLLHQSTIIQSVSEFRTYYSMVTSRRTFVAIRDIMQRTAERTIASVISKEQLQVIMDEIFANDLSSNTNNILPLIKPALAHATMAQALTQLSFVINDKGLQVLSSVAPTDGSDESRNPDKLTIKDLQLKAQQTAAILLTDLSTYIYENADNYSQYKLSDIYLSREANKPTGNSSDLNVFWV